MLSAEKAMEPAAGHGLSVRHRSERVDMQERDDAGGFLVVGAAWVGAEGRQEAGHDGPFRPEAVFVGISTEAGWPTRANPERGYRSSCLSWLTGVEQSTVNQLDT